MHTTKIILVLVGVALVTACVHAPDSATRAAPTTMETTADSNVVTVNGRTIDLEAHLTGFPFDTRRPKIDLRSGRYFATKRVDGGKEELIMVSFAPEDQKELDLYQGTKISPRDFTERNFWGAAWSPLTNRAIIMADEKNDEIINLYELDVETGEERQLTNVAYIYDFAISHDGRYVACTTRSAKAETSPGDVRIVDLANRTVRIIYTDSPRTKMVWGDISWHPEGKGVLVPFMADSKRIKENLMYVPLDGNEPRILTDTSIERRGMDALDWIDDNTYLYKTDGDGSVGIFRGNLRTGDQTLVTRPDKNVKSSGVIREGDTVYAIAITGDPRKSTLELINASTGETIHTEQYDGMLYVYDTHDNQAAVKSISLTNPFSMIGLHVKQGNIIKFPMVAYPRVLLDKVVHCDVEKVSFPTFDRPNVPGEKNGRLHAYLLSPKRPLEPEKRHALVLSFYGGNNYYRTKFQILCEAGYYVLSPAPRGTSDFGTEFFALGEGDWGGGETLDAFYAGMFLKEYLSLPADRIGIFGGSRGGYDTMRALTFPGSVNGISVDDFRFGFGISDYGISDILAAAQEGNIKGWYEKLTGGDPSKAPSKWRDRSPITHVDNLRVPLLLTHGTKDNRVPFAESQRMYEAGRALDKDVMFIRFPGQGHGYKGVEAKTKYFSAVLQFLEKLK